jgi:hypothetical protein
MASLRTQKHHEIYSRSMLCRGHGYAPYIPEPSSDLPMSYQLDGADICDVIMLTRDSGYDYLFNCSLPSSDPKNAHGVPRSYEPFSMYAHTRRRNDLFHPPGIPISSSGSEETKVRASAEVQAGEPGS